MTPEEKIADLKANFDYVLEGKDLEIKELKDRLAEEVELHLHAEEYINSLEKENTELRDNYDQFKASAIPEIERLQKENAELKNIKDVADLIRLNNSSIVAMACLNNHNTSLHQELAQAKEILQRVAKSVYLEEYNDAKYDAEQFLKGENIILEDAQTGNSPFDADEVFNKEMKAYPEGKVK